MLVISLPLMVAGVLALALLFTLLPFFTPSYYRIDAAGITIQRGFKLFNRQYKWLDFGGCRETAGGFWLIPLESRAAVFRALYLPFPPDSALLEKLRNTLEEHFPII